jgi:CheY-like chemotaxis protein
MLGRFGFEVEYAFDGEEALARLSSESYRAVFLDCNLPKVHGIEVARRCRAAEAPGRRALLIATTALSTTEDRDACIAAGMDAFVTKPITPEKLGQVLSDLGGSLPATAALDVADSPEAGEPGLRLNLIRHLADGSPGSMDRELAAFTASLDEAVRGVAEARASGAPSGVSSAAHRVLSLARMVGAQRLASSATDIQDFASAYTDAELNDEIAKLVMHANELEGALERLRGAVPLNPSLAS